MDTRCDVLIVGGGLVGSSLACALDGLALDLVQIEAEPPRSAEARWDERHFALARRTVEALAAIGAWPAIAPEAQAIRRVEVSSRGDFGVVRIAAADYGLESLGSTAPARAVAQGLARRVEACQRLRRVAPARVVAIAAGADAIEVEYEHEGRRARIRARLLVGADGTASFVRGALGIGASTHDYGQTAIAAAVEIDGAAEGVARERFTPDGPLALLPLSRARAGLVWTVASAAVERVLALDDGACMAEIQALLGHGAGRLRRIGRRQPWPLALTRADALTAPRAVLVGNAAQTLHPIGAQGFNLGLRDAMVLAREIAAALRDGTDPGAPALLAAHAAARAGDRARTIEWTDGLVRGFAHRGAPLRFARGLAMAALERWPDAKRELAWRLMGYPADASARSLREASLAGRGG